MDLTIMLLMNVVLQFVSQPSGQCEQILSTINFQLTIHSHLNELIREYLFVYITISIYVIISYIH